MIKIVYEHICTINIQLMKKYWNRTWVTYEEKSLPDAKHF